MAMPDFFAQERRVISYGAWQMEADVQPGTMYPEVKARSEASRVWCMQGTHQQARGRQSITPLATTAS